MIKKYLILFFIFSSLFFLSVPAQAGNDLLVTCTSSDCITSPASTPLFSESDVKPGLNFYQNLNIDNTDNPDTCDLYFSANQTDGSILKSVLQNQITRNTSTFYAGSMEDLFNNSAPIYLDSIPSGSIYNYLWKLTMDENAGNQYQGQNLTFDLLLDFYCGQPPAPTDTPPPPPPPPPNPPEGCTAPVPATPTDLTALIVSPTRVQLDWTHVIPPYTHYLIAYGPSIGDYRWGNPDVGSDNTYIVGSLTPGAQYCFYVRAINDCMPGEASDPVCINTGSVIPISDIPAPGFEEGVLGEQTEITPTPTLESGQIEGTQDDCARYWLPLLYILAFFINLIHYYNQVEKSRQEESRLKHIFPLILPPLAYFVDKYFLKDSCCLVHPLYCRYFWIGNILSWLIPRYYYHKQSK